MPRRRNYQRESNYDENNFDIELNTKLEYDNLF